MALIPVEQATAGRASSRAPIASSSVETVGLLAREYVWPL